MHALCYWGITCIACHWIFTIQNHVPIFYPMLAFKRYYTGKSNTLDIDAIMTYKGLRVLSVEKVWTRAIIMQINTSRVYYDRELFCWRLLSVWALIRTCFFRPLAVTERSFLWLSFSNVKDENMSELGKTSFPYAQLLLLLLLICFPHHNRCSDNIMICTKIIS